MRGSDIAMCRDDACPSRTGCVRHAASGTRPNPHRQTYAAFHREPGDAECDHYVPQDEPHLPATEVGG